MSHPRTASLLVDVTEQAILDGYLDHIAAKQGAQTVKQMCHVQSCIFSKGHAGKHSWEYTQK